MTTSRYVEKEYEGKILQTNGFDWVYNLDGADYSKPLGSRLAKDYKSAYFNPDEYRIKIQFDEWLSSGKPLGPNGTHPALIIPVVYDFGFYVFGTGIVMNVSKSSRFNIGASKSFKGILKDISLASDFFKRNPSMSIYTYK